MPIRSKPFLEITAQDVESLRERDVREDYSIDYKRADSLDIDVRTRGDDRRSELLKDISGFANASGGTIVYGVVEGTGEQRGAIAELPGVPLEAPDQFSARIDGILRDGFDEPIPGILHKAIYAGTEGRYFYVIRVPPSPLAPHMVDKGELRFQFFLRGNVTTDRMSARQIKEVALRAEGAEARARQFMDARVAVLQSQGARTQQNRAASGESTHIDQAVLHVVPLFPPRGGWDFTRSEVGTRLLRTLPFGVEDRSQVWDRPWFTQEGMYSGFAPSRHVAFMRSGALEFWQIGIAQQRDPARPRVIPAAYLEQDVIEALDDCAGLTADGLLPLPVLVRLALLEVEGAVLWPTRREADVYRHVQPLAYSSVVLEPVLVSAWGRQAERDVRRMFDQLWQTWGWIGSRFYRLEDGSRRWIGPDGYEIDRPSRG